MKNLYRLFIIACITVIVALGSVACSQANAKEPEVVYLTVPDRTEYVYVIADVAYPPIETESGTELDVVLPNGEIHAFYVEDVPDGVSEVVIKTFDIDDYATYEIVGMR